jgi:hypothetical protein
MYSLSYDMATMHMNPRGCPLYSIYLSLSLRAEGRSVGRINSWSTPPQKPHEHLLEYLSRNIELEANIPDLDYQDKGLDHAIAKF